MKTIFKLIVAIAVTQSVGVLGGLVTMDKIGSWYAALDKPFFTPPSWLFSPVWITLYLLMGISVFLIWNRGLHTPPERTAFTLYWLHLVFNWIWTVLFFGLQLVEVAFIDSVLLWMFIILLIKKFSPISKPAAYLLIPYLCWVTYATALNLEIMILN